MSWKLRNLVEKCQLPFTRAEKAILLCLADYGREDGTKIFPGASLVARKTLYSERHVKRTYRKLEEKGVIIATNKIGGRGHTTNYVISLSRLQGLEEVPPADESPEEDFVPPGETDGSPPLPSWAAPPPSLAKLYETLEFRQRALAEARLKHSPNIGHWEGRVKDAQEQIAEAERNLQHVTS